MKIISENYLLNIEEDSEGFDINLYSSDDLNNPLLYLNLKPLNEISFEFDDKLQIRDIPRHLFVAGDYYQSSVKKYNNLAPYFKISLLSIVHDIIYENQKQLIGINRIFSSSLNYYKEESFITENAVRFWEKQLAKFPGLPVFFLVDDKRYCFQLN